MEEEKKSKFGTQAKQASNGSLRASVEEKLEDEAEEDPILAKLKLTKRKRSLLESQVVMNWLRNLARTAAKDEILEDRYYKRTAEIQANR